MEPVKYQFTASWVFALIATIVFAVAAFEGHEFISLATGLTFFAASFLLP